MRRQLFLFLLTGLLLALLAACSGTAASPAPSAAPALSPTPAETTPVPTPLPQFEMILPVTEKSITDHYIGEGYRVLSIEPYEDDFLVRYAFPNEQDSWSSFAWIFGATGRRVRLPVGDGSAVVDTYKVTCRGCLDITTTGESSSTPGQGFPALYHMSVLGDENGFIDSVAGYLCNTVMETCWLLPEQTVSLGSEEAIDRYEVVYDVRAGLNDLTLSFVPPASAAGIGSFITAVTTIPYVTSSFDEATRVFLLRLHRTALDTGDPALETGSDDWVYDWLNEYEVEFPHSVPAGPVGADNRFFTDALIYADGENTILALTLTDHAVKYTMETGHLDPQKDMFPYLRLTFRDYMEWQDEEN